MIGSFALIDNKVLCLLLKLLSDFFDQVRDHNIFNQSFNDLPAKFTIVFFVGKSGEFVGIVLHNFLLVY